MNKITKIGNCPLFHGVNTTYGTWHESKIGNHASGSSEGSSISSGLGGSSGALVGGPTSGSLFASSSSSSGSGMSVGSSIGSSSGSSSGSSLSSLPGLNVVTGENIKGDLYRNAERGRSYDVRATVELTAAQNRAFLGKVNTGANWRLRYNCSSWATESFYGVTGVQINAGGQIFGIERPSVIVNSIKEYK